MNKNLIIMCATVILAGSGLGYLAKKDAEEREELRKFEMACSNMPKWPLKKRRGYHSN